MGKNKAKRPLFKTNSTKLQARPAGAVIDKKHLAFLQQLF